MEVIITTDNQKNNTLTSSIDNNIKIFKQIFSTDVNDDFTIKYLQIKSLMRKGAVLFIDPLVDKQRINDHIISPLLFTMLDNISGNIGTILVEQVLSLKDTKNTNDINTIIDEVLSGNTILLIDKCNTAIILNTDNFQHRAIEKPTNENTLKGPKEAFTEWGEGNRSLIRKSLKTPTLVTETLSIGKDKHRAVSLMYLNNLVNSELLSKVKERIYSINNEDIDRIVMLEQWIEDRPYSLIPTTFTTERPDRVCYFLKEGHIALLMDSSSNVIIVPVTFWTFFHTADDMYQRWLFGNFLRIIRVVAIFIAIMLPGLYIAVTNFHTDIIPTDLVIAVAASREKLPFPALVEILLMEMSFELIREAGVRIPTAVGPTIGIVGALILGQAAVEANIVSPILVIVVALTGLSSFAIPEQSIGFIARISRFIFLFAGTLGGFFGIGIVLTAAIAYTSVVESFGVPYFSPKAPHYPSSRDFFTRRPIFKLNKQPMNLEPQDSSKNE
ncbi:spore germination protein [Clostridium sp. YIM B02565]|uniref:Spore germination protein n=1 Tax=Clostridium paridis TaxID=2803863 RepID=A0A937FF03_9CLOT|nr:spore germination protein [Clostridium paridis]MBL4930361.1 spore germination protein [Clostridium paridis]